jgi:SOS-response transcriptional repressor LexA
VSEIIGGRRGVKAEEVPPIARYLEMTEQEVIAHLSGRPSHGGADGAGAASGPAFAAHGAYSPRPVDLPAPAAMPLDLPVFGTAVGGGDADFEMNGEVIDRVRRPPGLAAARNAFALYVVGTSMSPRYDEGDLIFIHPGKPPVPGCDVVVELQAVDEFGRHKALLKTYRGKTPTRLLLSQFNPEGPVELPLGEVRQVLRVMRTHELLGL